MDEGSGGRPARVPASVRRRRWLLGGVAAAVLVSVAGLGAASLVKSPQQAAADAGPPPASVITAAVESRQLTQKVVSRGTVSPTRSIDVVPVASGKLVVSKPPLKVGTRVRAGDVVSVVSGRPIITLQGKVPTYRDLREGMKGDDVLQVQRALSAIGYGISDRAGVYGVSTQAAVKRLYEDRGFDPVQERLVPEPGPAQKKPRKTTVLPSGEILFVPAFPARVTKVKAKLGAVVDGPVLVLAAGRLRVRGLLTKTDRKLIDKGDKVSILDETTGKEYPGKVVSIGAYVANDDGQGHPLVVMPTGNVSDTLSGQEVRLTIASASTDGKVLTVPLSAIFATADGSTRVVVLSADGTRARVEVTTGAQADGFVEVTGQGLAEGDRVVVSEDGAGP
ncbi:efflux RND transporter periplasmic adaptor subunit [Actinocorallia sp. A-T 12471]|uniref:efflux RND transporter periplasmic adaptor subunit n=1 Tax=Actinocorallia sp. A-T 12471 TaxID=3089813 RepID=UPI0029CC23A4|nr:peptidoglycan-binding protein [Actinocorallia sp. A-T 12471]MDX6742015.1 HlyD family efflux transporter periplasmic adaptor subunit [Actinocorallia sp. A-T 12471]